MNPSLLFVIVFISIGSCWCNVLKEMFGGPLHASCKIEWNFGISCNETSQRIVSQITKWGDNDCGSGEKCGYKLTDNKVSRLLATHTTPVKHYVDDLTFTFQASGQGSCRVHGFSTSETWYAVLDAGTNYCNLHNLVTGSGLDKTVKYTETTSDSVCTQFSSSKCDKY